MVYFTIGVNALQLLLRGTGFETRFEQRQIWLVSFLAVASFHLSTGLKPRNCDHAVSSGAVGWESNFHICVSVCEHMCLRIECFLQEIRNGLCDTLR